MTRRQNISHRSLLGSNLPQPFRAVRLVLAGGFVAAALSLPVASSHAQVFTVLPPTVIGFDSLTGPFETVYPGHFESGFTVQPTTGTWYESVKYGNVSPSIYTKTDPAVIQVTSGGGLFNFLAFDFSSNNGQSVYDIRGYNGPNEAFNESGVLPASYFPFTFNTLATVNPTVLIDALLIQVTPGAGVTSVNLDNLVVAPIPEPQAWGLMGLGLAALLRGRFSRRL